MKEIYKISVLLFFLFLFTITNGIAQQIENLSSSFDGIKITVSYDLIFSDSSRRFKVELLSSLDSFVKNLSPVSGAAGEKIKPGKGLKITWEPRKSLPADFDKEITFKVRASLLAPIVVAKIQPEPKVIKAEPAAVITKLNLINQIKSSYRRGTELKLLWAGGKADDRIVAELIDAAGRSEILQTVINKGELTFKFPAKLKTTNGYLLKITPNGRTGDSATSSAFIIRHRVPLLLKLLPIVPVAIILLPSKKSEGNAVLPSPINPN